jgi:Protein of unknown function (DUF551)
MNWQPIETAPKDGTEIIAYGIRSCCLGHEKDEETWSSVWWASSFYLRGELVDAHWVESKVGIRYNSRFTPTHWMPLPEPPKE